MRERHRLIRFGCLPAVLVVVGFSTKTMSASFQGLGDLPGGSFYSAVDGVSADGTVVVGDGHSVSGSETFLWMGTDAAFADRMEYSA